MNLELHIEQQTMSSLDFLKRIINPARAEAGENKHKNSAFFLRACDELELDVTKAKKIAPLGGGPMQNYLMLTEDQLMLVGMRESKAVRKSVLTKLKELTAPVEDPVVLLARQVIKQDDEIKRLGKVKAQINDKRTATLMNKASQDSKRISELEKQLRNIKDARSEIKPGYYNDTPPNNEKKEPLFTLAEFAEYKGIRLNALHVAFKKTGTRIRIKCKQRNKRFYQKSDLIAWYNKEYKQTK